MNPSLFLRVGGKRFLLLPLFFLLISARLAWGQDAAREHFQIKIGTAYDRGDYGSTQTTRTRYLPVTFRYLGEKFDFSVAPSLAQVDTAGGVVLIGGVPTPIGTAGSTQGKQYGAGDTLVRAHYYLLEGTTSRPSITPFAKVKVPTAQENLNLSTGKTDAGFGVEWDKQISQTLLFGDVSYTFIGQITGITLRNQPGASFGIGHRIAKAITVSGMLDWRRSILEGNPNPTDLIGVVSFKPGRTVSISPNIYAGLNSSSAAFGAGLEFSWRFGRY
jgi:hypothetical protein